MICVTKWQLVDAETSHIIRRSLHSSRRHSFYNSTRPPTARAVPAVQTTNLPGNWQYSRCLAYVHFAFPARGALTLIYSEPGTDHVFPNQLIFSKTNSAQICLTQCSTYGYPAAGMENGDECCLWSTVVERLRRPLTGILLTRVRRCGGYR